MPDVKVAAVQMNSGDDVGVNLDAARGLVEEAARRGAGLAVLPENFAFMSPDEGARVRIAESDGDGRIQAFLARTARECGLWLVGGTVPIAGSQAVRPYAACCVYDDSGRRVARYDKMHLFDVRVPDSPESYRESARTMPGDAPLTVPVPCGPLGVAVCYDVRFPELFRLMATRGAVVIALPAAFTERTGRAHWHALLRARAIENLAYVVAAAQSGEHPGGRRTYGHSLVFGPWGELLAEAAAGPGVITATVEPAYLERLREQFPVLDHRRLRGAEPTETNDR